MKDRKYLYKIVVIVIVIAVWFLLTLEQTELEKLYFPAPLSVWNAFARQMAEIGSYSLITWYRVVLGLLIGGCLGALCGVLMSCFKTLDILLDPIIEIIRPIPPVALTPFFILWFGLSDAGQLLLISLGCFMTICVAVYEAVRNVNPTYIRAARTLGADRVTIYRTVILPAILPLLLPNVRVALAGSFALAVAAEYLGAQGGLGYLIRNARTVLQTDTVLLAALILGAESLFSDYLVRWIFGRVTRWMPGL